MTPMTSSLSDQLRTLGLTTSETKAYLAVVRLGPCTVTEIARESKLQRTEIYRLMSRLAAMGLVEGALDRPKRYETSSIRDAISLLTEKSASQLKAVGVASRTLVTKLEAMRASVQRREESQVRVITGLDNIQENFFELLTSAQREIWVTASQQVVAYAGRSTIPRALAAIASKQVKAKVVFEINHHDDVRRYLRMAPLVEVRHHHPIHVHLCGVDDRAVSMGLTPIAQTDPRNVSALLVTHPSYVKTMRDFFNAFWEKAVPLSARLAMLQGRRVLPDQTRIIRGREELYAQLSAEWKLRAKDRIANTTTRYGPVRMLRGAKETYWETSKRGVRLQIVCDVCPENVSAVKELGTVAEIRHNPIPLSMSIEILDESEALIHYVQPDTPDLTSPTDLTIVTTNKDSIHDLRGIFDLIWEHSLPLERRLQELSRTRKDPAKNARRPRSTHPRRL